MRSQAFRIETETHVAPLRPVLRWAGGKSHLASKLLPLLPSKWARYIEPMVGGGALFFLLRPPSAILSDINYDLVNFYKVLKRQPNRLIRALSNLRASRNEYYRLRTLKPRSAIQRAIRFAYLNRLCWNGLYRVNRNGEFNVPIGDRFPRTLWKKSELELASRTLRSASLAAADFEQILDLAVAGDLVFLDPPYPRGASDSAGFTRYSPTQFSLADHQRLAGIVSHLSRRRVKVMLTIGESLLLLKVYPADMHRTVFTTNALISCRGGSRREVQEVVLRNYSS
jgi:DNA adenine methylase